jgi:D-alanine-D-alanine ligase
MVKINKHIEIVRSTKVGLSSVGRESGQGILGVLSKHYANVSVTIINNLSDLEALVARRPDLVFLGMKFIPMNPSLGQHDVNKIWLTQYLDEHEILYTGSNQSAHKLEFNKQLAKQRILGAGLKTAPFHVARQNEPLTPADLPFAYPMFIKPTNRGGGSGIDNFSLAHNFKQLQSKVRSLATQLQSDSLIEEYLPGREFSVAILKEEYSNEFSVMPIELIAPQNKQGARFLSAQIKLADTESNREVTDLVIKSKITTLAIAAFDALGARDYGRIDIRLDDHGGAHFLEANLLPSLLNNYGNFPKACLMNIQLEYEPMILSIVRLALARSHAALTQNTIQSSAPYFEAALAI